MSRQTIDQAKAEAFAGQMVGTLNSAGVALMTSVGHRTGLLDTMATLPPSTSQQIAAVSGLNERYVREWLGAMTTGRVVEYDATHETYTLPPEHAMWLTRAAGEKNMSLMAQFIPLLGAVEDGIVNSFRNGGGVHYGEYPHFHKVMAEVSGATFDATLLDTTLPLVPNIVERLQLGIDVADIGCGSGYAINIMAAAFPNSQFIGYDFSEEAIETAKRKAEQQGLSNARFEVKDIAQLNLTQRHDFITAFDCIHDQAKPDIVLKQVVNALRPDGAFLMVDITASSHVGENMEHVIGPLMYTVSCMHCMSVSLALDGAGLGAMWGEQKATQMLSEAGFAHVEVKNIEEDMFNSYYIAAKGKLT